MTTRQFEALILEFEKMSAVTQGISRTLHGTYAIGFVTRLTKLLKESIREKESLAESFTRGINMGRAVKSIVIAAATNNIPTAFSAAAGSRAFTGLGTSDYSHVMIVNETAGRISVVLNADPIVPPATASTARAFVLGSSTAAFDNVSIGDAIYIQSDSGSAVALGTIEIMVW